MNNYVYIRSNLRWNEEWQVWRLSLWTYLKLMMLIYKSIALVSYFCKMVFQNTHPEGMIWSSIPNSILLSALQKLQYNLISGKIKVNKKYKLISETKKLEIFLVYLSHFVPESTSDCDKYLACKSFMQVRDAIRELCAQKLHPLANLSFPICFFCIFQDPLKAGAPVS